MTCHIRIPSKIGRQASCVGRTRILMCFAHGALLISRAGKCIIFHAIKPYWLSTQRWRRVNYLCPFLQILKIDVSSSSWKHIVSQCPTTATEFSWTIPKVWSDESLVCRVRKMKNLGLYLRWDSYSIPFFLDGLDLNT